MNYKQLNYDERIKIDFFWNECKYKISKIAKLLNRSWKTIKRELERNSIKNKYIASEAEKLYKIRFKEKQLMPSEKYLEFTKLFMMYFDKRWHGVEATWTRIKIEHPNIKMPSIKQTFNIINSNKWVIKRKDRLRRKYFKGGRRNFGYFSKFNLKYIFPIWTRKKSINSRKEFGHWEIDLVLGLQKHGHKMLLTLTERKTRMLIIVPIKSKNPHILNAVLHKIIKKNNLLVKSITSDNGLEFKALGLFGYQTGIDIYKCNPYASHERGTNENTNGLIRRMYPKKTDFNKVSNIDLEILMDNINNMPRKIFNFKSSYEIYAEEMSKINLAKEKEKLIKKAKEKRKKKTSRKTGFIYLKNFNSEL